MRKGEYIRVDGRVQRLSSYRHWLSPDTVEAHDKVAPEGRIYLVRCPDCGCVDWESNGRYVNEYSCASCVESYMEVYFHYE